MRDFADLTRELTDLMKASAPGMIPVREGPGGAQFNAPIANPLKPNEPMWFGAVRAGKAYVSYHLMPVYSHAALAARISPALKKRMQGKSCFNFSKPDPELFEELAALTREGATIYSSPFKLEVRR